MKNTSAIVLIICLVLHISVFAGLNSKMAAYQGGTAKNKNFPEAKDPVEGNLNTGDDKELKFEYKWKKEDKVYSIPYDNFIDIEYGQKAGRRVGTAVATTVLLGPIGMLSLFSKKRKHFITIGYKNTEGKEQVAVFELGKDIVRTTLPILEARSGKKIEYQDDEAKKSGKGN